MSHPQDYSGRQSRRPITPVSDEDELQYEPYSPQTFDPQIGRPADAYITPQSSATPYPNWSSSRQTSVHLSSQDESSLFSPNGSHLSNTDADTSLSNPLADRGSLFEHGHTQRDPQSPYVRGASCSINSYESNQNAPERERRHSLRSSDPLPSTGKRSGHGGSHHGSNWYPNGSSSRSQRDQDTPVLEDDNEVFSLEGHRNPPIPPDLPPATHRRRNTLAGVGGHLDGRLYHSDTHVRDPNLWIYGNSNEDGRGYNMDSEMLSRSPESLVSSMASPTASMTVHQGSAPRYVPLFMITVMQCVFESDTMAPARGTTTSETNNYSVIARVAAMPIVHRTTADGGHPQADTKVTALGT